MASKPSNAKHECLIMRALVKGWKARERQHRLNDTNWEEAGEVFMLINIKTKQ